MLKVIDRRLSGKNKSLPNRERFLRRYKAQIKEAVADAVRGFVDGHIVLDRKIAERDHYPAINVGRSLSRLAAELTDKDHAKAARKSHSPAIANTKTAASRMFARNRKNASSSRKR